MDLELVNLLFLLLFFFWRLNPKVAVDLPAAATLRLGKYIKAITVPTCQKRPKSGVVALMRRRRWAKNPRFVKKLDETGDSAIMDWPNNRP